MHIFLKYVCNVAQAAITSSTQAKAQAKTQVSATTLLHAVPRVQQVHLQIVKLQLLPSVLRNVASLKGNFCLPVQAQAALPAVQLPSLLPKPTLTAAASVVVHIVAAVFFNAAQNA